MKIRPQRALITAGDYPDCPHCHTSLAEATLTVEELISGLGWNSGENHPANLEGFIPTDREGYALSTEYRFPRVICPTCQKPSLLKTDGVQVVAWPARTEKDWAYISGHNNNAGPLCQRAARKRMTHKDQA